MKLMKTDANGYKLVNNNSKVLENTNGCKITVVSENPKRIHRVLRVEIVV